MLSSFSRFGMCRFLNSVFQLLSTFLKGRQSETLKDFWLQTGVNSDPPSLHVSFFLFFCRLFWKLLIFVSVNPTFLQLGVQFFWLCFLCLPCTYAQWNGGLLFEPLSFVLQSSLWWVWVRVFVVFARFVLEAESSSWQLSLQVSFCFHHHFPFHKLLYVFK